VSSDEEEEEDSSFESYLLTGFLGLGSSSQLTQPGGVVGLVEELTFWRPPPPLEAADPTVTVSAVCCLLSSRGFSRPLAVKSSQSAFPLLIPPACLPTADEFEAVDCCSWGSLTVILEVTWDCDLPSCSRVDFRCPVVTLGLSMATSLTSVEPLCRTGVMVTVDDVFSWGRVVGR